MENKIPKYSNAPVMLTATSGDEIGEIDLQWEPVRGARYYIVQVRTATHETWAHSDIANKSSCTVSGLRRGYNYFFRVAAVDANGQGDWSRITMKKSH